MWFGITVTRSPTFGRGSQDETSTLPCSSLNRMILAAGYSTTWPWPLFRSDVVRNHGHTLADLRAWFAGRNVDPPVFLAESDDLGRRIFDDVAVAAVQI